MRQVTQLTCRNCRSVSSLALNDLGSPLFLTDTLAQGVARKTGVEPFDLEWTWAIFLGTVISALVIYLIITKR